MAQRITLLKMSMRSVFFVLMFFVLSCKHSPTGPYSSGLVPSENVTPGRRDYVWTADTIKHYPMPYLRLAKMWGSAPNDIWAVGEAPTTRIEVWHYDGSRWTTDSVVRNYGSIESLYGFSKNDVWIGGFNGEIWHYTGSWQQSASIRPPGYEGGMSIQCIWGPNANEIYAVGGYNSNAAGYVRAAIRKYNGRSWDSLPAPDKQIYFNSIRVLPGTGEMLLAGYDVVESAIIYYLYVKTNDGFKQLYQGSEVTDILTVDNVYLLQIGTRIYYYAHEQLNLWKDFSSIFLTSHFFNRNSKDVFSLNHSGLLHWNGSDVSVLYPLDMNFYAGVFFEKEVFFLFYDEYLPNGTNTNIILHGVLKE